MIPSGFFQYIYHIGCGFNLHSVINSGLIPGGQNSSKRQTVFFLLVDPRDKSHKDPDEIDLNVPRHAQYLHNAWKRHQDAVYWVDINHAIEKGLKILSDSTECNHPSRNTSSLLYSKSCWTENWRSLFRKSKHDTSTSAKELTKARMDKRIGSERICSTRGSCSTSKISSNQPNQLQVQIVTDRGDLMTCKMEETRPVLRRSMFFFFLRRT